MAQVDSVIFYGILKYHVLNLKIDLNEEVGGATLVNGRSCALCGTMLAQNDNISICCECIKIADCCNGLEDLSEDS